MKTSRGFTLMEVMIAVSIVAIMGGLIWGAFGPFLRAKEVVEQESEHYRTIQAALARMSREISMAFVSNNFDHTRYRDAHDMPTFFTGERDKLTFTAFAHQRRFKDAKESDQALFAYRMGHDPEEFASTSDVLLRREKPILDDEPDRGGSEQVLCDDIKKIHFEFYDDQRKEWVEEWDTRRDKVNLPERVRITITSVDERGKDAQYSVQAKIFMREPIKH